ncbi:protein FATTY ACID EXPORT 2, chloroplastic-like [Chenopodium quinoa]|uniref:protein FATTY ACID EXPORT 2, chloroplastic-like n=1 Tax=Chenopodium quinoa TaxID=63459 RepID=UPI000B799CEB|nr:protein FATTY ACID EXPORT 2, chloroplastic-like [Chenopodium quinoa]
MTRLITGSQSSLLLPQLQPHATLPGSGLLSVKYGGTSVSSCYKLHLSSTAKSRICQHPLTSSSFSQLNTRLQRGIIATAVSSTSSLDFESPSEVFDVKPDFSSGGGDDGSGGDASGGGGGGDASGGGGGGDGGDDNSENKGDEGSDDADAKKSKGLSMSQKLTLAYAALVGLGGLMGYLKSGSQKSLASGGLSALLLYYVYTELPKRPVFASSVGLGLSAALLVVMGSRFKKSGKVFPAGVVSLVSLIMTGGYAHGVMRSSH